MAEEAVIYPALAQAGKLGHANMAYTEQAAAKMQLAALEIMDPMSEDFEDKLGHLEGAVATHVYQEESNWFEFLSEFASQVDQERVTARYREEYGRYMDGETQDGVRQTEPRSFAPDARTF